MPRRLSEFRRPDWVPVRYDGVFMRQTFGDGSESIVVAPADDPFSLLLDLAQIGGTHFYILWVLHTARGGSGAGRYQSPLLSLDDVSGLLHEQRSLLTEDGRHDLWLHSPNSSAMLVWDRHELLHLYGPLSSFEARLLKAGLKPGEPQIPAPHAHNYYPEFDAAERAFAAAIDWSISPLRPEDVQ